MTICKLSINLSTVEYCFFATVTHMDLYSIFIPLPLILPANGNSVFVTITSLAPYICNVMSHHLFLLSPSDTPLYSLTHHSTKPVTSLTSPLAANLPTWSTSAFAGTLTALSGASSAPQHTTGGSVRMGGGQDRHVIQMIANASLDVIEDVMRKENTMCVCCCCCNKLYVLITKINYMAK